MLATDLPEEKRRSARAVVTVRDSTRQDFIDICGSNPPAMFRGKTVTRDGEPVAIAGLAPALRAMEAFSSIKPGTKYGTMEALRVSIEIIEWMRGQCDIIYCAIEEGASDRYHRWIGFQYAMTWQGKRIYRLV